MDPKDIVTPKDRKRMKGITNKLIGESCQTFTNYIKQNSIVAMGACNENDFSISKCQEVLRSM
uniref:Uncharacterized protein n=1 Tax=Nelumbo nucifera TaxID=4432 RepID=A0A822ZVL9_NELNU|nr:TPA_asm: hypothetical protein HUJ06_016863 [Nelumbo nucifera]